ncbi:hypothetical protein OG21DRAFT_1522017 [Imleria badia]|nr:hypothetical protein OG21DRAFT_1522017 [Imleria badia]
MKPPTLSTGSHPVASLSVFYQKHAVLGVVYNPCLDYLVGDPLPSLFKTLVGSDRATPVIKSKYDAYLRPAADPAVVERGWMVHALRMTRSGALKFYLVAQGGINVCWLALSFGVVFQSTTNWSNHIGHGTSTIHDPDAAAGGDRPDTLDTIVRERDILSWTTCTFVGIKADQQSMRTDLEPAELRSILTFAVNLGHTLEGSQAIQASSDVNEKRSGDAVRRLRREFGHGQIKKAFLTFKFDGIREVSFSAGSSLPELTVEPTFCVDFIDDTTNFEHGFRFYCVFLGLIYTTTLRPRRRVQFIEYLGSWMLLSMFCWFELDVAVADGLKCRAIGMVIALEAGGVVTDLHAVLKTESADADPFKVTPEILTGRKYLVIRVILDLPNETGISSQLDIANEYYAVVNDTEPR